MNSGKCFKGTDGVSVPFVLALDWHLNRRVLASGDIPFAAAGKKYVAEGTNRRVGRIS